MVYPRINISTGKGWVEFPTFFFKKNIKNYIKTLYKL